MWGATTWSSAAVAALVCAFSGVRYWGVLNGGSEALSPDHDGVGQISAVTMPQAEETPATPTSASNHSIEGGTDVGLSGVIDSTGMGEPCMSWPMLVIGEAMVALFVRFFLKVYRARCGRDARNPSLAVPANTTGSSLQDTPREEEKDEARSPERTSPSHASLRLRASYRGSAAKDYVSMVSAKMRQGCDQAPYRILSGGLPQGVDATLETPATQTASALRHALVSVELSGVNEVASENRAVPSDVPLLGQLDHGRAQAPSPLQLNEARVVLSWVAKVTDRPQLSTAASKMKDLEAFGLALRSGEALCELANALATSRIGLRQGTKTSLLPVPSYHKNPQSQILRTENVSFFLSACRDFFKVPEWRLCRTSDLSEGQDLQSVVHLLLWLQELGTAPPPGLLGSSRCSCRHRRRTTRGPSCELWAARRGVAGNIRSDADAAADCLTPR